MKRNPQTSRAPSPTPTAFSGISAYKNDSYRPIKGSGGMPSSAPAVPSLDPRIVARTHFDELNRYLSAYLAKGVWCLWARTGGTLTGNSPGELTDDRTGQVDAVDEATVPRTVDGCVR